MKLRISKQLSKNLPAQVVNQITRIANDHHIKSFNFETVGEDKVFYVGEGDRFTGINSDGKSASFEVVSAHNIGASGLSHRIGEKFSMPSGSYLIQVYYYTKFFMTVYKISSKMIGE